jgi:hypothetical protein
MLNEKILASKDNEETDDDPRPPTPPPRHEKWKRARTKKGGEYTSEAVESVAKKIVSKY